MRWGWKRVGRRVDTLVGQREVNSWNDRRQSRHFTLDGVSSLLLFNFELTFGLEVDPYWPVSSTREFLYCPEAPKMPPTVEHGRDDTRYTRHVYCKTRLCRGPDVHFGKCTNDAPMHDYNSFWVGFTTVIVVQNVQNGKADPVLPLAGRIFGNPPLVKGLGRVTDGSPLQRCLSRRPVGFICAFFKVSDRRTTPPPPNAMQHSNESAMNAYEPT